MAFSWVIRENGGGLTPTIYFQGRSNGNLCAQRQAVLVTQKNGRNPVLTPAPRGCAAEQLLSAPGREMITFFCQISPEWLKLGVRLTFGQY